MVPECRRIVCVVSVWILQRVAGVEGQCTEDKGGMHVLLWWVFAIDAWFYRTFFDSLVFYYVVVHVNLGAQY